MSEEVDDYITLCALIHAQEGMGKSWLGQSTPAPRLVLDAEGGSRNPWRAVNGVGVKQRKVTWNPAKDEPPLADGSWDTCHVPIREYGDVQHAFNWLNGGDHDFKSVTLDSVTEIQQRCKDAIGGENALRIQDWDLMMIRMSLLMRRFRDLVSHPTAPLDAVIFLALSEQKNDKWRPWVQGGLAKALPGYVDVEGYLYVQELDTDDENGEPEYDRRLLIHPLEGYAAKDRTHTLTQHYGKVIKQPDIEQMLAVLNEEEV